MEKVITAEPFAPGEYIQEELDARGWTQADLAEVLKMTPRQVANLLSGSSALTSATAILLGQAFDQDPKTWMNLQVSYELALAAQKDRDVAKRAAIFNKVPVREMKKRCWLPDVDETGELEKSVCKFLKIPDIAADVKLAVAARKGTEYGHESAAQVAWYMRVHHLAERAPAGKYSESNLSEGINELRQLTSNPEDARRVPSVLNSMGIRFVFVQHLKGTRIEGVAQWLDENSPVIALSMRYDRIDNFWFNLFHEIVHVKYRHKSPVDTDHEMGDENGEPLSEMERIANSEAANYLVPNEKLDSFIKRMRPYYYLERVVQFARSIGVHPGIVAGQLHKRKELQEFQLRKRNILVPIRDYVLGQAVTDGWGNELWLD